MSVVSFPRHMPTAPLRMRSKNELLKSALAACRQDDVVYALIHSHHQAYAQWSDSVAIECELAPHHPMFRGAEVETAKRAAIKSSLMRDLLHTKPATIEGVVHFAHYLIELHRLNESEIGETNLLAALQNVAGALEQMQSVTKA